MTKTLLPVLLSWLLLSPLAVAKVLPVEDFVKHGDYLDIQISPDGEHLAARVRHESSVVILFIRRSDGQLVGGLKPADNDEVHSVTWVSNSRVVYQFSEKTDHLDRPVATGELFAVNIDGSQSVMLYGYRAGDAEAGSRLSKKKNTTASHEILSIMEGDDDNILIIEYPWTQIKGYWYDNRSKPSIISTLNIFTGRKKKIETLRHQGAVGASAVADKYGHVNFMSWTDEAGNLHAAYRKKTGAPWQDITSKIQLANNPVPLSLNADASKAYLSGQYGERGITTLYELNLTSGQFKPLFSGLKSDLFGWINEPKNNTPVIGVSFPFSTQYHYLDNKNPTAVIHRKLASAFKGQNIWFSSRSRDGRLIVVWVGSDINPGEYYIYDTKTNKAEFLWANRSWIDPNDMSPTQNLSIKTQDGQTLHALLTIPKGAASKAGKSPMVVLPHGGPHGVRDYWGYDSEVQLLANRGYAVLQVNFRGSGGFGEAFETLGHRQWGGAMIDDILTATRWAIKNKNMDKNRVCIYGASYGGYAAMMASIKDPALFKCTIGYVGVYDLNALYNDSDIKNVWGGQSYLDMVIGNDSKQLAALSPINHADKLKSAVMLIHGDKDKRAPIDQAKAMNKALKKAHKPVEWLSFRQSGHGVWDLKSRNKLYTKMLDFLDKNIGG